MPPFLYYRPSFERSRKHLDTGQAKTVGLILEALKIYYGSGGDLKKALVAMQQAGVYDSVKVKLVLGENVSQAAQFVQSGAADIGIIALSLARSGPMEASGKYWEIPPQYYPRIEQAAVLMKNASPGARTFVDWLRRSDTREILERYGFGLP